MVRRRITWIGVLLLLAWCASTAAAQTQSVLINKPADQVQPQQPVQPEAQQQVQPQVLQPTQVKVVVAPYPYGYYRPVMRPTVFGFGWFVRYRFVPPLPPPVPVVPLAPPVVYPAYGWPRVYHAPAYAVPYGAPYVLVR